MTDLAALQDGPDPDDQAAVDARIAAAELAIAAGEAALDNLEMTATIDGTVVQNDLIVGQTVVTGSAGGAHRRPVAAVRRDR